MSLTPGTRLGPYEIVSPAGAGGMGEVYRARDTRLSRTVAIKILPATLSSSPEARQRFEREARTISQLSHPHICALYDVGREGEIEYLVMEFLEGQTLAERLAKGPLPLDQVIRHGIEISDALDRAHRAGIVHRDLKPGNVMLTSSGVKLLDFGLAREFVGAPSSDLTAAATQAGLTQEGVLLGTLQYMAPEQLEGRTSDARTDIFALGAVLYEMATGRKAFSGTSQASLITSIMSAEPAPVSTVQPLAPAAFDRVVRRCLAKDPERRWQSARDVALELQSGAEEAPRTATMPSEIRRSRGLSLAGWAVAALLAIAGLLFLPGRLRRTAPESRLRFTIPPPAGAAFEGMLALSPDGRSLAFVATTSAGQDLLFVRPLDGIAARTLEGTDGASYPFWSPDGRFLAFFAGGKLKRIEATGGAPQTLCDAPGPRGGSWGRAGTIVFAANIGGQVRTVSEAGGLARTLSPLVSQAGEVSRWPTFLPDGRHFLYFKFGTGVGDTGVFVSSVDASKPTRIVAADAGVGYAPGYVLFRSGDRLMAAPFDSRGLKTTGEPFPVVEDIWWDGISTFATAFSVSDTGILAYQTGGLAMSRLLLYDRDGRQTGAVGPAGAYLEPALSPDGRWVALSRTDASVPGIWLTDLGRGTLTRLSSEPSSTPVWSPDGKLVAYSAFPSGDIFTRDFRAVGEPKKIFKAPSFSPLDDWSRDGRFLFREVIDWTTFHFDVAVRDVPSGTERPVLKQSYNQSGARLSPDGRWLAYESEESGSREIYVRSFPSLDNRRQISIAGGSQARWRGDGKEVFYVSPDRKIMAVDVRTEPTFQAGEPRVLFQTRILPAIEARNHYDVTSDGQKFLVNSQRPEDAALPITVVVGWTPQKPN